MKKKRSPSQGKLATFIKRHYQHIFIAAAILLMVLIVYGRDLEILTNEALQNEALNHVLIIPFFAGFLLYLKKDMIKASLALEKYQRKTRSKYLDELMGVILCLIAFLLYWYGSYTFYPLEYHILSLPIFILGVTLILFNLKMTIALIFPILFLMFLVPLPTEFTYSLGGTMANVNTQASYGLLKIFGLPVTLSTTYGPPTIVLTSSQGHPAKFTVDLPCSGIYSLIAFAMFAAFLALVTSSSILKKVIVVLFGFLIFEVLNIIRITLTISIANWFGEEIAMNMFHSVAGIVLIFVGMLLTLIIAEKVLKIRVLPKSKEQPQCPECETNVKNFQSFCSNCGKFFSQLRSSFSKEMWAKLFLLILGCAIVTMSINAPTFAIAQGPIGVSSTSNWTEATSILPNITDYQPPRYLYRDTAYEKAARQDASLMYGYFQANLSGSVVYVAVNVANSISNLHNWEVCLITWQTAQGQYPLVSVLDQRDLQLLQDVPIIARYLVFISPANYTQVTLYWYEKATFNTGISVEQKYVRISLIILTYNSTNYRQLEDELLPIGQDIAAYWEPLKTQSLISLGIPAQQSLLIASVVFVAFAKIAQYSNDYRKRTNNVKIFNSFASEKERLLLKTIQELPKTRKTMETRDIAAEIETKTGKPVELDELVDMLNHLEEYGFIRKDVVSIDNKPRLIWKAQTSNI